MEPEAHTNPRPSWLRRRVPFINVVCFLWTVGMFFLTDLNGEFIGMDERLSIAVFSALAVIGLAANFATFHLKAKEKFITILLGLFYVFCILDACRVILTEWL